MLFHEVTAVLKQADDAVLALSRKFPGMKEYIGVHVEESYGLQSIRESRLPRTPLAPLVSTFNKSVGEST